MAALDVPPSWHRLTPSVWSGPVLFLGGTDTGKSTMIQLIYEALRQNDSPPVVIDGDPGQSSLGPPTTLTAALPSKTEEWPPDERLHHSFVGAPTPRGHMLEVVVGARRLVDRARKTGTAPILYDTTGLISVHRSGRALKYALVDLLRPTAVVALQRDDELEPLLPPLRQRTDLRVLEPSVPDAATQRSTDQRRRHRAQRFASYFEAASLQTIHWPLLAVRPNLDFARNQIVAFETSDGWTRALGRIENINRDTCRLTVETPLSTLEQIESLRLGDVTLDPGTYEDKRL